MRSSRNPIRPPWFGRNWSSFLEMKCKWIKFHSPLNLASLMLAISIAAYGQRAPQVQEILDRLDKLEKANQALLEEVRALRQEISGLSAASPEPAAQSQTIDER